VRGVTLQPVQDAGRNENFNKDTDRIMLSEIRKRVVETGVFGDSDMIPLPCNPESISIGYGLRNGAAVLPLTSLIPQEQLLAVMPNTISPEKYPALKEKFIDLFSLSSGPLNTSERVAELLCCLPAFEVPDGLSYANVFRVTIVQFLDRFNFCVGNVKRSCIHFVTEQGQIIPFDTYNLFYRDGKIDRIRAGLAGQTFGHQQEELQR
jgi:7,8-dihydro-6-hydroxymethylpterin dimethyltransferase